MREQMNKNTIKEKIEEIKKLSTQNEDGQFEIGTLEQQNAAKLVEQFYNNFDLIKEMDEDTLSLTTAATIYALKDIQVRDYVMGLMNPEEDKATLFFKFLTDNAPHKYNAAPTTLLALTYYQKHQDGKANEVLAPVVAQGYPLATLLNRVFISNWPVDAFNSMRMELHPKVTAGIFGGTDDNSK
jgi:hypothetical protein